MVRGQPSIDLAEHSLFPSAKKVVILDPFGSLVTQGNFTSKIDEVDSNTTYIGVAQIGSATSDAVWQIKKVGTSGTVTTISYAGGTDGFESIWDNRAALSYS